MKMDVPSLRQPVAGDSRQEWASPFIRNPEKPE
jgi:hypothetical protein